MWRLLAVGLMLVAGAALAAVPTAAPVADKDTVVLWHFDEPDGDTAADASGLGHTGKITGAKRVLGKFGGALAWDESNGNVTVPGLSAWVTDGFTLQAWVRLDKLPTNQVPFWASDVTGRLGGAFITIRPPGVMYVALQLGSQTNYFTGQKQIAVGEWTHLAMTYDGSAGKIGLFVNGELDRELDVAPGSPVAVNPVTSPFFARSYGGGDEKLVGAIDEVCLSRHIETFGHRWQSNVFVHLLRYQSAFLVGVSLRVPDRFARYDLQVSSEGGTALAKTLPATEVAKGAVVPAPGLKAGSYTVSVTGITADGTRELLLDKQAIGYTPPERQLVDLRPDNVCLVNGQPFFPLGAYHVRQEDLAAIKAGGMNVGIPFTGTYPPGWSRPSDGVGYIEKCAAEGIMGVAIGGNAEALKHYRGQPDVLFWYLDDEPNGPGRQPEDILKRWADWSAQDPTHPYFLLHNTPVHFLRYAPACDIFATDPYPVHSQPQADLNHVARYTEGAVTAVFDHKPVWVALQCYTVRAVSEAGKSQNGIPRLPTPEELRCMSYTALACGARGLLYYAYDDTYYNNGRIRGVNIGKEYPEFWAQMTGIMRELGGHAAVWTAPYATLQPVNLTPDVIVQKRPYAWQGKTYVLVVNTKYTAQAVRVKLPGCKAQGAVSDALAGSPGQVAKEELTDNLQPLQAKCYVLP